MPEFNLIKFDGKPFEKLIEVISNGIGTLYRPMSIRKDADANAYKIGVLEKAKNKAIAEGKEIEVETLERIEERMMNREIRKQKNIDNVAFVAAQELKEESTVSDEPVDIDWSTRFFNIIEDISDEEMQTLWGRILAGEVKKPKSYSLRTLDFLKNLSKNEAMNFVKIAELAVFSAGKNMVFNPDNGKTLSEKFNITFTDILELKELGLLNMDSNLKLIFEAPTKKDSKIIIYQNKGIVFERSKEAGSLDFKCLVFTSIGMQLLPLINPNPNMEYIKIFRDNFESEKVCVKLGDVFKTPDSKILIINLHEIPK